MWMQVVMIIEGCDELVAHTWPANIYKALASTGARPLCLI
jgi:hypothetical protein